MASSSETPGLCPDWILSSNSNVHVSRDRGWFTSYTPFQTFFTPDYSFLAGDGGPKAQVVGIGDVEIPVKLFPKRSGPSAHGKLRLHNVLHAPGALCNIIGGQSTGDYHCSVIGNPTLITDKDGRRIGYFEIARYRLLSLKLSGPPVGPVVGESPFQVDDACYMIHAHWPDSQRRRWVEEQPAPAASDRPSGSTATTGNGAGSAGANQKEKTPTRGSAPYTEEEKDWLKRNWGGEFKFLIAHGLSIYDEDDRDMGRKLVRAMMVKDEDEDANASSGDDDSGAGNAIDLERWPEAHSADYLRRSAAPEMDYHSARELLNSKLQQLADPIKKEVLERIVIALDEAVASFDGRHEQRKCREMVGWALCYLNADLP